MIYAVIGTFVLYALYYRYVPVRGVKELQSLRIDGQVKLYEAIV